MLWQKMFINGRKSLPILVLTDLLEGGLKYVVVLEIRKNKFTGEVHL